jgi:hypothetical protein
MNEPASIESNTMSEARQMTIVLDQHMKMLEVGAEGRDRDGQIAYWREIITHAENIEGWFGPAVASRAKGHIKRLEAEK